MYTDTMMKVWKKFKEDDASSIFHSHPNHILQYTLDEDMDHKRQG